MQWFERQLMKKQPRDKNKSFITNLIAEECKRDPVFKEVYEAEKLMHRLVEARIKRKLTQAQVATAMGIHQPAVVRIERKPQSVSLGRLLKYAHVVGIDLASANLVSEPKKSYAVRGAAKAKAKK